MEQTTPIRQCIGCGQRDAQRHLLRFTLDVDGALRIGAGNGRGAYFHRQRACIQAFATSRSGLVRSLRIVVSREMRAHYAALIEQDMAQQSEK
jgi:predicted RNA-binding protein YlxR (DUF448 family)